LHPFNNKYAELLLAPRLVLYFSIEFTYKKTLAPHPAILRAGIVGCGSRESVLNLFAWCVRLSRLLVLVVWYHII